MHFQSFKNYNFMTFKYIVIEKDNKPIDCNSMMI